MKLCPLCKEEFAGVNADQRFCGGGHCDWYTFSKFVLSPIMDCPYCDHKVSHTAVICSGCGGLLSIGSLLAIKHALAFDPALALQDSATVEKLKIFAEMIDLSLTAVESEEARQKAEMEAEESRFQAEVAAEIAALELEDERLWTGYLSQLSPSARFLSVKEKEIKVASIIVILFALVFAGFSYNQYKTQEFDRKNSIETWCSENYPLSGEDFDNIGCLAGFKAVDFTDRDSKSLRKQNSNSNEGPGLIDRCWNLHLDQEYRFEMAEPKGEWAVARMELAFIEGCNYYFGYEGKKANRYWQILS
jgi:hypothetical protein